MINLPEKTLSQITQVIASFPAIQTAYLYGSRARGDHKPTSDIDIAIITDGTNQHLRHDLYAKLEEDIITALKFDILDLATTANPALLANIERDKIQLYPPIHAILLK